MTDWVDEYERSILALITEHGVAVQGVGGDRDFPQFAYTVGLTAHQHPEVVIVGLPMGVAQTLLNDLSARVFDGTVFEVGDTVHELVSGFPVRLVGVTDSSELLTMANRIYRADDEGPVPALQVVFPDAGGLWPWDAGSRVSGIPLLGPVPGAGEGQVVRLR